ncbi:GNAT family N-acetyltransferase [Caulobacter soli]|uniref:GNAT family N-acetyltransferase n=1 Tax=Caulobacter soli TaxID=2708539 RepID=UPI0013ED1040|nr:GNAT family N-acetyltransferase [Caulobacter soli]
MAEADMIQAERDDVPAMVALLAAAFVDDPPLAWILPDRADRQSRLATFFEPIIKGTMRNGLALRSPGDEAVTLWRLPGGIHPGFIETLSGMPAFVRALGDGAKRAQVLSRSLRTREPDFPYRYLQFAGVAPALKGKGWGGRAVRAGLAQARAAGVPVYLETSKAENVAFYRHLGFNVLQEWDVPEGGPHVWSMLWR